MNTPNKLTVARMIMVPFLVVFLLTGWGGETNRYIALVIFAAASITDWFDGYLARKNNLVTNFGKFMDPLADKLLVCSAMICMIELGRLPAWFVIIIIGREFVILEQIFIWISLALTIISLITYIWQNHSVLSMQE